jgi:8-oxo-dGTP pyrophosphatase MutT (NUDIX family)
MMRQTRRAARVAVLDEGGSIFLFRYDNEEVGLHWAMPGGGMNPGETPVQAARRELQEETGWTDIEPGIELWRWEHDYTRNGVPVRQLERVFCGSGPHRQPTGDLSSAHEEDGILRWRWWSPADLDVAAEPLWPPQLPDLLSELRRDGAPAVPIDLGYAAVTPISPGANGKD